MIHGLVIFQNYPITLTSEDAKRGLLNLAERGSRILIELPPKTTSSPLRIRSLSRGKEFLEKYLL